MPLNLSASSGDFVPYLKFNSKAGRFYAKFDGFDNEVEVQLPRLVFDFPNIQTGWIAFGPTGAPQTLWDPSLVEMAPDPGWAKCKRGFRVRVVGADPVPNANKQPLGVREMMATAAAIIKPIMAMYDEWEADASKHMGELPFYRCTGVVPVQGQHGTNYQPEFEFVSWIPRGKLPQLDTIHQQAPTQHIQTQQPPAHVNEHTSETAYVDDDIPF